MSADVSGHIACASPHLRNIQVDAITTPPEVPAATTVSVAGSSAGKALAGVLSVIGGVVGALALVGAWSLTFHGAKGGTEGWAVGMLLIVGWGMLYVAVAAWMVPSGRWPLIRWAGAVFPAALIVYSAWAMAEAPSALVVLTFVYGAGAGAFLVSPEVRSWWQRMRERGA